MFTNVINIANFWKISAGNCDEESVYKEDVRQLRGLSGYLAARFT